LEVELARVEIEIAGLSEYDSDVLVVLKTARSG
jgi:hypothetical protein